MKTSRICTVCKKEIPEEDGVTVYRADGGMKVTKTYFHSFCWGDTKEELLAGHNSS